MTTPTPDESLAQKWRIARDAWPGIALGEEAFRAHVRAKCSAGAQLPDARAVDLYLACACAHADPRAIAALEAAYFPDVDAALRKMRIRPTIVAEVTQAIRCQLFVGQDGRAPLIADYSGRCELRGWGRTVAVHAALKVLRRERKDLHLDADEILALPSPGDAPDVLHLKNTYAAEFKSALTLAIQSLAVRDRNLIR